MPNDQKPIVVLVDDEDMILTSIRTLLMLEADYEVECFTNPQAAVAFLEKNAAAITVSDYLMPGLTGIQLLAEAKRLQPQATRVLLTGHADKASAIQAINQVGLFQYLEKPWDNTQLLLVIQQAVERDTATRLAEALATAAGVPAVAAATERAYRHRAARTMGWPVVRWLRRLRPDPDGRSSRKASA